MGGVRGLAPTYRPRSLDNREGGSQASLTGQGWGTGWGFGLPGDIKKGPAQQASHTALTAATWPSSGSFPASPSWELPSVSVGAGVGAASLGGGEVEVRALSGPTVRPHYGGSVGRSPGVCSRGNSESPPLHLWPHVQTGCREERGPVGLSEPHTLH